MVPLRKTRGSDRRQTFNIHNYYFCWLYLYINEIVCQQKNLYILYIFIYGVLFFLVFRHFLLTFGRREFLKIDFKALFLPVEKNLPFFTGHNFVKTLVVKFDFCYSSSSF